MCLCFVVCAGAFDSGASDEAHEALVIQLGEECVFQLPRHMSAEFALKIPILRGGIMSTEDKHELLGEAVEVMNRIFDTPLGWLEDAASSFSPAAAVQFQHDVEKLVEIVSENIIRDAITFLDRHRDALHLVLYDPSAMAYIPRSVEYGESFASKPRYWGELTEVERDRHYATPYFNLTPYAVDVIFRLFISHEADLLRSMGFNQNSVAIILDFLNKNADRIRSHLIENSSLRMEGFDQSASLLRTDASTFARQVRTGGLIPRREFQAMRHRLCAIGTIVGDVMPLILGLEFGVAGIISPIAGAAVIATITPSD